MKKVLIAAMTACVSCVVFAAPSAKAVYDSTTTTLTFYYDEVDHSGDGVTVYDISSTKDPYAPGWYDNSAKASLIPDTTQVVFDTSFSSFKTPTCGLWFSALTNLESIMGIEYLDTSEATSMCQMFNGCSKLTSLDISGFNTAKVTSMQEMFYNCSGLTSLDFSGFDVSKVTNMRRFVYGVNATELDLSSFDTSSVTDMRSFFEKARKVKTIYVSDLFVTDQVTASMSKDMFGSNSALVGGSGTKFASGNPADKTYARIDNPPDAPGYFTLKVVETLPVIESVAVSGLSESGATVSVGGKYLKGGDVFVDLFLDDVKVASETIVGDFGDATFSGLASSTTYGVRVVATNLYGSATNETCTFKTLAPAGENWEYDATAGTISWGGWTFAATVADGTTDMTVGEVQSWPDQTSPLDFSRTVVAEGTPYAIVALNPRFGHQDKDSSYKPAGYEPQCLRVGALTLPGEGLTSIAVGSFAGCVNATGTVALPSTVTFLGDGSSSVFADCANLTVSGAFPAGLTAIGQYAFRGVKIAGELCLTSVVTVADSAFQNASVGSVRFGPGLKSIGANYERGAFQGCTQLTNLSFDAESSWSLTTGFAFKDCTGLTAVDFKGLTNFTANATRSDYAHFTGCKNLKKITFGAKLETIATNAIAGATALESVTFEGVPPVNIETPLFSTYKESQTITTCVHRKLIGVDNAAGMSWNDYAEDGAIGHRRSTWASEYAGTDDLSKRPLLTVEHPGLILIVE